MVGRQHPAIIVVVFRVGRREARVLVQYYQKECLSSMMSHTVGVKCRLIRWFVPFVEVEMTATADNDAHKILPSPLLPSLVTVHYLAVLPSLSTVLRLPMVATVSTCQRRDLPLISTP